MRITSNFNRLYHSAFLNDLHKQMIQAKKIRMTFAKFKDILKELNPDYPVDEKGNKISTTKISSKALIQHIDFIVSWAGGYGVTPTIINDEWERLMQGARE